MEGGENGEEIGIFHRSVCTAGCGLHMKLWCADSGSEADGKEILTEVGEKKNRSCSLFRDGEDGRE